jgi:hypothetical protein
MISGGFEQDRNGFGLVLRLLFEVQKGSNLHSFFIITCRIRLAALLVIV